MITTKSLIAILKGKSYSQINIDVIIDKAHKNKILLHTLRVLNLQGLLRETQESAIKKTTSVVQALSKILEDYEYAFFKLVKPVAYVPADVDILINIHQAGKAAKKIMGLGYKIVVKDPYCITLTKADSIIDLYAYPSLGGTVILNGQKLLEHTTIKTFNETEIITIEGYAEALVTAAHAIYKERIYTLNDYITIKKLMRKETLTLSEEFKCKPAIQLATKLNQTIEEGLTETPYKIPIATWIKLLTQKISEDPATRATSINLLTTTLTRQGIKQLKSKIKRETY